MTLMEICVQSRKDKMIGHILKQETLLQTIIEWDIEWYKEIGRPKIK